MKGCPANETGKRIGSFPRFVRFMIGIWRLDGGPDCRADGRADVRGRALHRLLESDDLGAGGAVAGLFDTR